MGMLQTRRVLMLGMAGAGLAACTSVAGEQAHAGQDAHAGHAKQDGALGVLVMAHGGGAVWNAEVEKMLEPLARDHTLELAFGMAEAASLQAGVKRLEARGAQRIAVVRLFISGESWYERTEQILGLIPGAHPPSAEHAGHGAHAGHGGGGHNMALWRIETNSRFALSRQGLAEAPEMGAVLVERVGPLSKDPARESVLIIGHGPETDEENERWLKTIDQRADSVRRHARFKDVHVETLREDWPEKRVASVARIRAYAEKASEDNGRLLVIPYRVSGFGPYADVLKDLTYEADKTGLLPSVEVEHWVRRQVTELDVGPFRAPVHAHG